MAIVFGVSHMMIGMVINLLNKLYEKNYASIFCECIPEFLLLGCTFGYLSFMIIFKWCINWNGLGLAPPDLLNTMSLFFLSPSTANNPPLYNGQIPVQITLLSLAILAIPWLLITYPAYEISVHYFLVGTKKIKDMKNLKKPLQDTQIHHTDENGIDEITIGDDKNLVEDHEVEHVKSTEKKKMKKKQKKNNLNIMKMVKHLFQFKMF